MFLKRIEIYGFKSFAEKTIIDAKEGITAIIGPNGSGKSNIVDAIRWVLGEQSIKSLRGEKTKDVIFSGTQFRKPLSLAEVSIVFDNSDKELEIEYDEVKITRRLYRDGESNYFINGSQCRLKTVIELFMNTGIGKDGYSVIGQGRIDELLSTNPEDRRNVFEEATGIAKYKQRKKESQKRLENTSINLDRAKDILIEIETNLKSLESEKEKAKEYLSLRDNLKDLEIKTFRYFLDKFKKNLQKINEEKNVFALELIDLKQNISNEEENILDKKEQIKAIDEALEESYLKLEQTNKNNIIKNSEITILNEKIKTNHDTISKNDEQIEENTKKIENLNLDIAKREKRKEDTRNSSLKYMEMLNEKEEEYAKLLEKYGEIEKSIQDMNLKKEENIEKIYELREKIVTLKANESNENNNIRKLIYKKQEIISNLDKLREESNLEIMQKEDLQNKEKTFLENIQKEQEDLNVKVKEKDKINNDYIENEKKLHALKNKIEILENLQRNSEGFNYAIKSLKNPKNREFFNSNTLGILADIIDTDPKFSLAIEIALGNSIQNIVVKDMKEAIKIINFLKENKYGRATFCSLNDFKKKRNSIFSKNSTSNFELIDEILKKNFSNRYFSKAINLIRYDSKYEDIFVSFLDRTIIVDKIELVQEILHSNLLNEAMKKELLIYRFVSLEGDIVYTNGTISGGYSNKVNSNLLSRKKEIENGYLILKKLNEKSIELKGNIDKQKILIEKDIKKLEKDKIDYQDFYKTYYFEIEKFRQKEQNIKNIELELEQIKKELEEKERELDGINKEKEEFLKEISHLENINKSYIEKIEKAFKNKESEDINELRIEITDLKISLNSFKESLQSIDDTLEILNEQNRQYIEEVENLKNENIKLNRMLESGSQEILNIKQEENELKENYLKIIECIEKKKKDKEKVQENIENIESKIADLKFRIEQIEPKVLKKDQEIYKIEIEKENIINNMWNQYELTPNSIPDVDISDLNLSKVENVIKEIKSKIKSLGNVNIMAIEEYNKLSERFNLLNNQKEDLDKSIKEITKVISNLEITMKEQFVSRLNLINNNFKNIFKELFGGGNAKIYLEDEKDVLNSKIEIFVEPPGKKLQSMSLLSGGEKAFSAIALLFSILNINPAPICVLDEIEAALDDVNVSRFANYLKKYSQNTQFLVITHRKGTMEEANSIYGITMEENGISKLVSLKLNSYKE